MIAIERRLVTGSALHKAFGNLHTMRKPFRQVLPKLAEAEYEQYFASAIEQLMKARSEVILRGPQEAPPLLGDYAPAGGTNVFDRLGVKYNLVTVLPTEVVNGAVVAG